VKICEAVGDVVAGKKIGSRGLWFNKQWVKQVWDCLNDINKNPRLTRALSTRTGSRELYGALFGIDATTLTGRIRSNIKYTRHVLGAVEAAHLVRDLVGS